MFLADYLRRTFSAPPSAAPRVDDNLPLKLKIGSLVAIEPTPFVFAKRAGLLVDEAPARQQVAGYGRIRYQGFMIHRFYLEDGVHMLQVAADGAGKIDGDPFLYKLMPEIRPQTPQEWTSWLADPDKPNDTGLIGYKTFDLYDLTQQPAALLASYARQWKQKMGDQAPLETFRELLYRDPAGRPVQVEHNVMMYGRQPPNPGAFPEGTEVPNEWLLLSKSEYPADAVVQIYVGLPIPEGTISAVMS